MKQILCISAAAMALAFTACDNVDENERFIPLEFQETEKVILIEEFTGAHCANCPTGAATVAGFHDTYGDQIIAVSLYPEQLTDLTKPYNVDLRTKLASDLFGNYNLDNKLPAVMFNRTRVDGRVLQTTLPSVWGATVYNLLNNPDDKFAPADITLTSNYDTDTRELKVNYMALFKHDVSQDVSFQVYVLENGIISRQLGPNGLLPRYENNHVLRTALNGTWGQEYGGNHQAGSSIEGTSSITLPADWNDQNIQVVGFICNTGGDHTVLHAAQIKSIISETDE